jgi:hypothetical protein
LLKVQFYFAVRVLLSPRGARIPVIHTSAPHENVRIEVIAFQKHTMNGLSVPSSSVEHPKASTIFEANILMQNSPDDAQDRFHHPQPDRDTFSVELTHCAFMNAGSKRVHLDPQLHGDSSFVRS